MTVAGLALLAKRWEPLASKPIAPTLLNVPKIQLCPSSLTCTLCNVSMTASVMEHRDI